MALPGAEKCASVSNTGRGDDSKSGMAISSRRGSALSDARNRNGIRLKPAAIRGMPASAQNRLTILTVGFAWQKAYPQVAFTLLMSCAAWPHSAWCFGIGKVSSCHSTNRGRRFSLSSSPCLNFFMYSIKKVMKRLVYFSASLGSSYFGYIRNVLQRNQLSPGAFAVLRLSRLYPLHFATLLFVAAGQFIYTRTTKTYFVYPFNDTYDFFLNLFFASAWGLEKGNSFNAPVWSVSVEILLYAFFFVFCQYFNRTFRAVLCAIFVGHLLHIIDDAYSLEDFIALGVRNFFIGGFVFMAYEKLIKTGDMWKVSLWLPFVASIAWLATIAVMNPNFNFAFDRLPPIIAHKIASAWPSFVLFPTTIMSLALIETKRGTFGKRWSFVGDISYSSYLLHFPLKLTVATVMAPLAVNGALFYSPLIMALFFCVLIIGSLVSHRYFEVPMQRLLRRKLPIRQKAAPVQEVA